MFARLSTRDQRALLWGATAVIALLLAARVVIPHMRRWTEREDQISALRGRIERLQRLREAEALLRSRLDSADAERAVGARRVLRGNTPALAAATLQGMLQEIAVANQVEVSSLEIVSDSSFTDTLPAVISGYADIYGLVGLLAQLESGPLVLTVQDLAVTNTAGLRGNLLQLSITLRTPYFIEP